MNFIIWLVVGGIVGWVASIIMRTNGQQGLILNIIVGIVGAFLAGLVLTPLLGIGTINQNDFSLPALVVSVVGAVILLAIVSLFQGRGLRRG
ncbi:MAG: GlsB/YeaQ/YmgE family stress response membrane protein [Chloroflexi bacterium]|nr:GlsB/YeaQ/YmgE family stress response membrane protein [Chloroflexota bacterium]